MCQLKSGLVFKDHVFVPEYDSHEKMLKELRVADSYLNASKTFVRVELLPENGDVFSDIDTWNLKTDQDVLPDWWDEEEYRPQVVEAVKEWAKTHIHIGVNNLIINNNERYYVKDCQNVKAYGDSTVTAYGNSTVVAFELSTVVAFEYSTVTAYGNSTVTVCDNSTVEAYDNSTVTAWHNSTVEAYDNSTVTAYDNSTVKAYGNSIVIKSDFSLFDKKRLALSEYAIFKDCRTKTIYQSGNWQFATL